VVTSNKRASAAYATAAQITRSYADRTWLAPPELASSVGFHRAIQTKAMERRLVAVGGQSGMCEPLGPFFKEDRGFLLGGEGR